jgi:CRP/FNR family transcriptional regulator, cyclic AMP receptor protein
MISRFKGVTGREVLLETVREQKIVCGSVEIAQELVDSGELLEVPAGNSIIEQGTADNDVYLILTGAFDIIVNGRTVARRRAADHVGEMAAVQPTQRRSATVKAVEASVVHKIPHAEFVAVAQRHPELWRTIAKELARRLEQRNSLVSSVRDRIRVFIISSVEALPIARAIQTTFQFDPFLVTVWTDGVFRASHYPVESLEAQLDASDFAVAIAEPDDVTSSRGSSAPTPRDNVIFELGLFIGRLGRKRTFLLEPRGDEVKLPSDMSGITTIPYRRGTPKDLLTVLAPACNQMRDIINDLGPST